MLTVTISLNNWQNPDQEIKNNCRHKPTTKTLSDSQNVGITYAISDKVPYPKIIWKEVQDDQITPETNPQNHPNQIADRHITTRATDTRNTTSAAVDTGKASQTVARTDREI